jgi:hypothetical protein
VGVEHYDVSATGRERLHVGNRGLPISTRERPLDRADVIELPHRNEVITGWAQPASPSRSPVALNSRT